MNVYAIEITASVRSQSLRLKKIHMKSAALCMRRILCTLIRLALCDRNDYRAYRGPTEGRLGEFATPNCEGIGGASWILPAGSTAQSRPKTNLGDFQIDLRHFR
jgi:hypothetical protein